MTSERVPDLTDLVMIFLKERYPYWKFRHGDVNINTIIDANGWTYAIVYDDCVQLMYAHHTFVPINGIIKAANPEFFELLSKHILDVKRSNFYTADPEFFDKLGKHIKDIIKTPQIFI
jgi:hypothetical protein